MAWDLKGNANTDPSANFLGTTDGKALAIQPLSGNVGIGTTRPDARLTINSTAENAPAVVSVADQNADTRVGLWSGFSRGANSPAVLYTHALRFGTTQDFRLGAGFVEAMRITSDGKVGIGTQSPASKVEIAAQDGLRVTGFQPFITLRDAHANLQGMIQCVDGHLALIPSSPGNSGAVVLQANTGRVGIGTTNPEEKLHVIGDAHIVNNNTGTGIGLIVEANLNAAMGVTCRAPNTTAVFIDQRGSGNILVGRSGPSQAEVFRVTVNGDVQVRGTTLTCDVNVKDNFCTVDTREVVEKVAAMPIQEWAYKEDPASVRHIGPTSQDFRAAFALNGDDETKIASVDAQGIALAAIQGLNEKLNAENAQLRTNLANLEQRLAALESNLPRS